MAVSFSSPEAASPHCLDLFSERSGKLSLVPARSAEFSWITIAKFRQIRLSVDDLLNRFPPDQYVYVALGRSPTPLFALLEAMGHTDVLTLPMTNAAARLVESAQSDSWIQEHLTRFLPDAALAKGKRVLVVDVTLTGTTLILGRRLIQENLASRGFFNTVEGLGLSAGKPLMHEYWKKDSGLHLLKIPGELDEDLLAKLFKPFSKYESWDILNPTLIDPSQVQAPYARLVGAFHRLLIEDSSSRDRRDSAPIPRILRLFGIGG